MRRKVQRALGASHRSRPAGSGPAALAIMTAAAFVSILASSDVRAGDANHVTVGAILPITGLFSTLGEPARDALQMGVDYINKTGGFEVAGQRYHLRLKVLDDESNPATLGVTDYRQLVDVDKVSVLVIAAGTRNYQALFRRSPLPVLNIIDSSYPSILDVDKHVFLLRSDTPAYVPGAVWYLKNVLKKERIAFIGAAADPYSAGVETWVEKSAEAYGVKLVASVNYPFGTTDFAPFIQAAMAEKPDAIYLGGVTQEVLPVAKQLYQSGIRDLPVLHNSGATPSQARQIIGDALYNDVMANNYDFAGTLPETSDNPATKQFYSEFLARFHEYPNDLTMWAYDTPFVLVAAMRKAATVSDREKIYQAMLDMEVPGETISGWIPTEDHRLFHDRDAQTMAEGVGWCSQKKTIAPIFLYFMDGLKVTREKVVADACGDR
jgi:branched-chain amino acid transport system substrate-binding protein